jgi:hypothetical protein
VIRPLDPAERYYWFVEQMGAMNATILAELDCKLDQSELRSALRSVQLAHRLLNVGVAVVDGELHFVSSANEIPLEVRPIRRDQLADVVDAEIDRQFDFDASPLVRAIYLPLEDQPGSFIITVQHHVISDGLSVLGLIRELLRVVAGEPPAPVDTDVPIAIHDRFPVHLASPKAAVEVLRAIRDERKGVVVDELPFHDRHSLARRPRFHQLTIREPGISELAQRAKAAGSTVNGLIAATVLESAAALFDEPGDRYLTLTTPAELRSSAEPTVDRYYYGLVMGVLSSPYLVRAGDNPDLPRRISEHTRREVQRGEAHLFYRFARASAYSADDTGIRAFEEWFQNSTPDSIPVSNMGRIEDTGDPASLISLTAVLSASSNQLAFISVTTYRGELVINVNTDDGKLDARHRDAFVQGIADRLHAVDTTRRRSP